MLKESDNKNNQILKAKEEFTEWKKAQEKYSERCNFYPGTPYTIIVNDMLYYIEPEYTRVVDDYGPGGSVELDHYEYAGYDIIKRYFGESSELDFSFSKTKDKIDITLNDRIKNIKLKSKNIQQAQFKGIQKIDYEIVLNTNIIETIINLKSFIKNNKKLINSITFQNNVNPILKTTILTCMKEDKVLINFESKEEMNKTLIKKSNNNS